MILPALGKWRFKRGERFDYKRLTFRGWVLPLVRITRRKYSKILFNGENIEHKLHKFKVIRCMPRNRYMIKLTK